ncbi:YopX family protein [Staphylococcus haemolyticus]|uniref:YopX family protein n=1 Tax=Staphylococcus haemolyticus TaxID=1283 RepID=UPI001F0B5243|nr:YopX family protein [Staphylococcus haemolyticus]MCH4489310.1 YopX family protein [Staphylococcus haemolyticus]
MLGWKELDLTKELGEDEITIFEPTGQFAHPIFFYDAMQSTGLKDMSGVEIYEGDIIKNSYDEIYTVKWFDASFYLEEKYNGGFDYHELYFEDNKKVIGNIYENPELLEDD